MHRRSPHRSRAPANAARRSRQTAYLLLAELAEKYLYTIGSPMQSEEHFIPFLEAIAHTPLLNDTEKSRPRFLLSAALKNRPGTIATDFAYFTPEGDHRTLTPPPLPTACS